MPRMRGGNRLRDGVAVRPHRRRRVPAGKLPSGLPGPHRQPGLPPGVRRPAPPPPHSGTVAPRFPARPAGPAGDPGRGRGALRRAADGRLPGGDFRAGRGFGHDHRGDGTGGPGNGPPGGGDQFREPAAVRRLRRDEPHLLRSRTRRRGGAAGGDSELPKPGRSGVDGRRRAPPPHRVRDHGGGQLHHAGHSVRLGRAEHRLQALPVADRTRVPGRAPSHYGPFGPQRRVGDPGQPAGPGVRVAADFRACGGRRRRLFGGGGSGGRGRNQPVGGHRHQHRSASASPGTAVRRLLPGRARLRGGAGRLRNAGLRGGGGVHPAEPGRFPRRICDHRRPAGGGAVRFRADRPAGRGAAAWDYDRAGGVRRRPAPFPDGRHPRPGHYLLQTGRQRPGAGQSRQLQRADDRDAGGRGATRRCGPPVPGRRFRLLRQPRQRGGHRFDTPNTGGADRAGGQRGHRRGPPRAPVRLPPGGLGGAGEGGDPH